MPRSEPGPRNIRHGPAWLTWIEMVVVLPATGLMVLSGFASLGLLLAIAAALGDTSLPLGERLSNAWTAGHFLVWLAGGWVGVGTLWIVVLDGGGGERRAPTALGRALRILGLLAGFAAARPFLMDACLALRGSGVDGDALVWGAILAGPVLVGARHLLRLLGAARRH